MSRLRGGGQSSNLLTTSKRTTAMSLNPASQPFIPSNPFMRRDSALRLGGDEVVYNSALKGDNSGVKVTSATQASPSDLDEEEGPFESHHGGGSRTPGRTENSGGDETVAGEPNDHSRLSSIASLSSSAASFRSARSSPRTPPDGDMANEVLKDGNTLPAKFLSGAYHNHLDEPPPMLTDSPRGSISSLSRSVSQDTESGESYTMSKAEPEDSIIPLTKNASSASFPALEAHFRRDSTITAQREAANASVAGPESVSSTGSGILSSSGLDSSSTNGGGQRQGFQLSPSPFSRLSSRFSTYGNPTGGGSANRSHTPINDLAPSSGTQMQQLYQTQVQSPSASRSMSLSLMATPTGNANNNAGLAARKSTFAFDYSPHQTPPSRSPLPNGFQSYNLGGPGVISQHASATNTPTDSGFRHITGNMSSNAALNPLSVHVGADNMSSSPSSSVRSSAGHIFEAAANFDAQAKASPFLNDILDRVIRCEHSTNLVQRELSELNVKVSLLLDRLSGAGPIMMNGGGGVSRAQANEAHRGGNTITPTSGTPGVGGGNSVAANFYSFPNNSSTSSLISPTPNLVRDRERDEEINQLNQRIGALTTSVGQLLAAQSQSHIQNVNSGFTAPSPGGLGPGLSLASNRGMGGGGVSIGLGMGMGTPSIGGTPDVPQTPLGLGGTRPELNVGRPSPRAPIPVRTWSSGSIDMMGASGRPEGAGGTLLPRDKRRSVITTGRRDSAGDPGGDWNPGSSRDANAGPVISKWEHLPLMPELLRSISKYGVGPPNKIQQRALPFLLRGADIIAQAPPTQERIAAYVIPAIHVALTVSSGNQTPNRGPIVLIVSTTVDQATQAQRMIRDMGGPIGVRSALAAGTGGDVAQEIRFLHQNMPHILCGTPQKLHTLFTASGGPTGPLPGSDVRFLVLDEVDQLIARNLHDFVFNVVKLLPPPRSRPLAQLNQTSTNGSLTPLASPSITTGSSFTPFDTTGPTSGSPAFSAPVRRFSLAIGSSSTQEQTPGPIERQTALFSNTVPQDVLNLANTIQLREPVRVLVRRDGNVTQSDPNTTSRGLRQYYLYLAFTAAGAATRGDSQAATQSGGSSSLGIIGSGRSNGSTLSSAETNQAREWKLDALSDLFEDLDVGQVIVHVGGMSALDAVVYKLASRGLETVPFHGDMSSPSRASALIKFRGNGAPAGRSPATRVLVVYDVQVKAPDVFQIPLIINYDLPKAVEEYAHR
ncbi:hypothetical protein FRB97_004342, partial [Tulasnella sp. 331]